MANPVITLILDAKNLASPQLKGLQKDLKVAETNTEKMGAAMGRTGMLMKGMLAAGAIGAAYGLANALAEGGKGAIEEEAGIVRLTTALRANIPAWDGNTDAIEKTVKARTDLGFADDELRDSLAALVPATRDVSKAFDVQRVAMDLARLKGISLQEASEALVKVEAGQYRMLKSLGIVLKDGATQTEALAAVQAVALGQAEKYADTTAGKMELLSKRFDELAEMAGTAALPAIDALTVSVLRLGGALDYIQNPTEDTTGEFLDFLEAVSQFGPLGAVTGPMIDDLRDQVEDFGDRARDTGGKAEWMAERVTDLGDAATVTFPAVGELATELQHIPRPANASADAVRYLNRQLYNTLSLAGRLAMIDLAATLSIGGTPKGLGQVGQAARGTASGGWRGLDGPELSWLGEAGPEYVVPNHAIPEPVGTRGGMSGGGITLVVNSAWPPSPAQAREFADMLDAEWAQRRPRYSPA